MKKTFLRLHLGLGDALICNGLIRTLVERGHHPIIPCCAHNRPSIEAMFSDIKDSLTILEIESYRDEHAVRESNACGQVIDLGYYADHEKGFNENQWDREFYRHAEVPFLHKWEKFRFPLAQLGTLHVLSPVFIHDDPERGYVIPMQGRRPKKRATIFEEVVSMRAAEEIHCINSCFAILADLIGAPGKKYLHRYARDDGGKLPIFGEHWTVLNKPI